jgi:hypothetical protein
MRNQSATVLIGTIGFIGFLLLWNAMTGPNQQDISTQSFFSGNGGGEFNPNLSWPDLDSADQTLLTGDRLARNVYIVFDGSGSMGASACSGKAPKIAAAKQALHEFIKTLPAGTNIGITAFDAAGTTERVAISPVDYTQIGRIIDEVHVGGGTPLSQAMEIGYKALTQQARTQLGYGEYHLLVVTDGEANAGSDPSTLVSTILSESPVMIHTIGFCIDKNHTLNQPGRTNYSTAADATGLLKGMQAALAEAPAFTITDFKQTPGT